MKKNLKKGLVIVFAFVAFNANMNAQSDETFNMHRAMSNRELRALVTEKPWMLGVYQASKGQDIDITTISIIDDLTVDDKVVGSDTTVFWKVRPFTGWRLSIGAGANADWSLGDNQEFTWGGVAEVKLGYAMRRIGLDAAIGLTTIGTQKGRELGYYSLSVQPYVTPFRGGADDQNRFDIGAIIGVQQAAAAVYDTFESPDGMIWGDSGRRTVGPRAMFGGFLRFERRKFMGASRFAIEASVTAYEAKATYSQYYENVSTGEVLLDKEESSKVPHIQAQLKLCWAFDLGRTQTNY
jgi:hypothetical protein